MARARDPLGADNVRTRDIVAGDSVRVGCEHPGCDGPPDWNLPNKWLCIDHVDTYLCCGSKLSRLQREQILAAPDRRLWIARNRDRKEEMSEADELRALDYDQAQIEHPFSWQEHNSRNR